MKKQTITLALLLALCLSALAQQEYKITKPAGKLYLNLQGAYIEGYDGNEIIFTSQSTAKEEDERAKGLQALSSSGFIDNTGMGISVTEKGQDLEVNFVGNNNTRSDAALHIRVPRQLALVFSNNNSMFADTLQIKNMQGEIEVSTSYNSIVLENNSGPMNIKAVYRDVEASFANNIKGPISIISVYGHVDVALPAATKANLTLGTSYGKLFADEDFHIAMTPKKATESTEHVESSEPVAALTGKSATIASGLSRPVATPTAPRAPLEAVTVTGFAYRGGEQESIEGTINGGGIDLILKSTYKNVYLRTP